jgi:YesN/AraC family two-component response regulator
MKTDRYRIKSGTAALKNTAVLSVEDDDEVQQQLSHFFKTKVKNFYTAFNGEQGLETFKKYKPNIVIADIRMPVMDGLEMSKAIKDIDKDIPIVLTTAYNKKEYLIKSNNLGINEFLLKPTDPYLLFNLLVKSIIAEEQEIPDGAAKCQRYNIVTCLVAQSKGKDKKVFTDYFEHIKNCIFCYNLYYQYRELDKIIRKTMVQLNPPHNLRLKITENLSRYLSN